MAGIDTGKLGTLMQSGTSMLGDGLKLLQEKETGDLLKNVVNAGVSLFTGKPGEALESGKNAISDMASLLNKSETKDLVSNAITAGVTGAQIMAPMLGINALGGLDASQLGKEGGELYGTVANALDQMI